MSSRPNGGIRRSTGLPVRVDARALGERLRDLRETLGYSQGQVAEPVVTATYLSRIENGDRIPGLAVLTHLAEALGEPVQQLMEDCAAPEAITDIRGALGVVIRERRLTIGLTQHQLAGSNITATYLSRIESGQRSPSPELLDDIAARLDTDAPALLQAAQELLEHPRQKSLAVDVRSRAVAAAASRWLTSPTPRAYQSFVSAVRAWERENSPPEATEKP